MLDVSTNAEEVASGLLGVVDDAAAEADEEAARLALDIVGPQTPRRTGRLAAGLRSVVVSTGGFDLVDDVPYASAVDARTGFASSTIVEAEASFAAIYDRHLQERLDAVE
jgi:hypothetical protein